MCSCGVCLFCKSPRHYLIYIVKSVSPCNTLVAFALSKSAVRGSIPAHHGNVIFFFFFFRSDGVYKIIIYLINFFLLTDRLFAKF